MRKTYIRTLIILFTLLLLPLQAEAQETSGGFADGSIRIGYDSRTCDSSLAGSIRFNSATSCAEYCDGAGWLCPAGCTAPASCMNVGDVCSDGSIYAGFVLYNGSSCAPLYVTDNNQSTASLWKNATGTNDISTDDHIDGKINAANRGGAITDFPAFDLCESSSYHGKSDWYLPARAELNLLWLNRAAIDANAAGSFATDDYWSSTETNTSNAWDQDGGSGTQNYYNKTTSKAVRCVRR